MAVMDMTKGKIFSCLVRYTVPLLLGNLFQLAYNVVDSMIAGRFIGTAALAATGMAGPVMNILILGISGICIGAGVLMSNFFGHKDEEKLKKTVSTLLVFGTIASLAVSALFIIFANPLLKVLNVPAEVHHETLVYLRIIFVGVPFTYFYNALSQALKSVGDSKTPLTFLVASSILNCLLDLFFIGYLGFGIACSALTTTIAQAVSALLCFIYIYKKVPILSLGARELKIDRPVLKTILLYGSVTALQQSVQPVGKLLIQSSVNTLSISTIAAYNAVSRIDDFALTPEQNISHAMTTFIAQNRGAENKKRAYQGFVRGMIMEAVFFIFISTVVYFSSRFIMNLFVAADSPEVIREGSLYLSTMAPFYILPAMTNGLQGFFRALGKMKTTLLGTLIQVFFRVVFTFILVPRMGISGICYACAIGWTLMMVFEVPYYFFTKKRDLSPVYSSGK